MKNIVRISAIVMSAAVLLAGCNSTYRREKADLELGGGQSYRLQQAKQNLDEVKAKNISLREEQDMARTELSDLQAQLKNMDRKRIQQLSALKEAREGNRISAEQQAALAKRLDQANEDFGTKLLELQSAEARGDSEEVKRLERELKQTNEKIKKVENDIKIVTGQ